MYAYTSSLHGQSLLSVQEIVSALGIIEITGVAVGKSLFQSQNRKLRFAPISCFMDLQTAYFGRGR